MTGTRMTRDLTSDRLGLRSVAVLLALCTLPLPAAAQQPLTPLKVGISDAVNTVLPFWMAQAGGFFAANGLAGELVNTGGGGRRAQRGEGRKRRATALGVFSRVLGSTARGGVR